VVSDQSEDAAGGKRDAKRPRSLTPHRATVAESHDAAETIRRVVAVLDGLPPTTQAWLTGYAAALDPPRL